MQLGTQKQRCAGASFQPLSAGPTFTTPIRPEDAVDAVRALRRRQFARFHERYVCFRVTRNSDRLRRHPLFTMNLNKKTLNVEAIAGLKPLQLA